MSLRGHPPHSGLRRHGSPLGSASTMHQSLDNEELVEKKLMEEIKRLARENSQYAEAQVILRRDIISAKDEMQKMQALIRSIETESNIQVRVTFEKAAKMELECREAPQMKMELEKSHKEAQDMMLLVQEMTSQLDRANKELQIARTDTKKLPEMISELEDMREEHQRLCTTFEHEKRMNMEKVEHLQAMERDLINMARQIERLQADVSRAESALQTPPPALYGDLQSSSVQTHPPPAIHGNGPYYIASTGTYGQMGPVQMNGMVAHPHANHVAPPPTLPPPPPTLPPPPPPPISPSPPPPPPLHPPASGEGSGGDDCTSVKGDNIGTDWSEEVGRCGSSESRVNEG